MQNTTNANRELLVRAAKFLESAEAVELLAALRAQQAANDADWDTTREATKVEALMSYIGMAREAAGLRG